MNKTNARLYDLASYIPFCGTRSPSLANRLAVGRNMFYITLIYGKIQKRRFSKVSLADYSPIIVAMRCLALP